MSEIEIKVGTKGDIYLKKAIQEQSGIRPNDLLLVEIEKDKLIFRKKQRYSDKSLKTTILVKLTKEEDRKTDEEINKALES